MTIDAPRISNEKHFTTKDLQLALQNMDVPLNTICRWETRDREGGQYGVEIELESPDVFPNPHHPFWVTHADGSLRGNGIEYVFNRPLSFQEAKDSLEALQKGLLHHKVRIPDSYRTSTHIHYNVRKHTFNEIIKHYTVYLMVEPMLLRMAGPTRDGNLFCLPYYDTNNIPIWVRRLANQIPFYKDCYCLLESLRTGKYSAFNMDPVGRFGSVEYRMFKSSVDPEIITGWMTIINSIDAYGKEFKDYSSLMKTIVSFYNNPEDVYNLIFGTKYDWKRNNNDHLELASLGAKNAYDVTKTVSDTIKLIQKELKNRDTSASSLPKELKVRKKVARKVDI